MDVFSKADAIYILAETRGVEVVVIALLLAGPHHLRLSVTHKLCFSRSSGFSNTYFIVFVSTVDLFYFKDK